MLCKPEIRQLFVIDITLTNVLSGLPILYDKKSGLVKIHERSKFRHKIFNRVLLTYTLVLNLQTLFAHDLPLWKMALSGLFAGGLVIICLINFKALDKLEDIVQLTNRMFKFEQKHQKYFDNVGKRNMKKYKTLLFENIVGTICAPVVGLAFWGFILLKPCFPGNFGYQLYPECGFTQATSLAFVLKIGFSFAVSLVFASSAAIIAIINTQFVHVFCYCYLNYMKYSQYLMGSKKGLSIFKTGKWKSQILLVYRQIQLLIQQHNTVNQHFIVVLMLMLAATGLTVSLYLLVTMFRTSAGLIEALFFSAFGFDCFMIIVVLSGMEGKVYTTSMETLQIANKFGKWQKNEWSRRVIRSWQPLKIGLGSVNFFDELTGISVLEFSIDQTVNLLLI